jgi:hypothetical protein
MNRSRFTNGDRIRAMSDEQLSKFLSELSIDFAGCSFDRNQYEERIKRQEKTYLEWLKQQSSEMGEQSHDR